MEDNLKKMDGLKCIYLILRIGIAMCFIGHGAFGIITKPIWCNYFGVFGIGHNLAYELMPLVGSIDIALGVTMLIYPVRAIAAWLVLWGIVTASLRPLSGEPFAEFIERAGNFGAPLMLLWWVGFDWTNVKSWLTRISPKVDVEQKKIEQLSLGLRMVVFLLLVGHGWLNLIHKQGIIDQLIGLHFENATFIASCIGWFEVSAAFLILIKPIRPFILTLFIWKMASELFYPHYELFEWIERGGSYTSLLALWVMADKVQSLRFHRIRLAPPQTQAGKTFTRFLPSFRSDFRGSH